MIVLAAIFAEFMTYDNTQVYHPDPFSVVIGLIGYFGIFMHSQKIINNNTFRQFAFVGLAIFIASIIKQALTGYNQLPLFAAGLPLLFVGYFRVLTALFYKGYPNTTTKPTIIFATQFGKTYFDGKDEEYKPPMKETFFSLLLLGFIFFAFGLILLLRLI